MVERERFAVIYADLWISAQLDWKGTKSSTSGPGVTAGEAA